MIVDSSGTPSRSISHHLLSAPRVALLGTFALWLGRHQTQTHIKPPYPTWYHKDIPAFCPSNKPNLIWNVRSVGHRTGRAEGP